MSEEQAASTQHPVHSAVVTAVEDLLERFEAKKREEAATEKANSAEKEKLTSLVSVATLVLTLLVSFVGFARAEREGDASTHSSAASAAQTSAEADWAHYQTRAAARTSIVNADEALERETLALPDTDARVQFAEVQHASYTARIAAIDAENDQVFFNIQELRRRQLQNQRDAAKSSRQASRYEMGTRVLTLAVLLFSVTLLAKRRALFWCACSVALLGAGLAAGGYFLR